MSSRSRKRREGAARWLPRAGALASFGLGLAFACRTEAPDEVLYHRNFRGVEVGSGTGGHPSEGGGSANPAGSSGGSGSTGGFGSTPAVSGGSGGETDVEFSGGAGGAPDEPEPADTCGPPPSESPPFSLEALRGAAVDCAIWQFCKFEAVATTLDQRIAADADEPSEAGLVAAQAAWSAAMQRWAQLELFQFGPLASRSESVGRDVYLGQGLRDPIYGWPSVARCRVEDQLESQKFAGGMDSVLTSARGLYALEYLLFYPGSDTACATSSQTAKNWPELSEAELVARKRSYATAVSADVLDRARALGSAYRPGEGDFKQTFVEAAGYPTPQEAMNVLAWALYYLEREVKDWKLGVPAGYTLTSPVGEPEAPYSGLGTELLHANLLGFRALFQGCGADGEGLGFDDWLTAANHAELSKDMLAALHDALVAVEAFPTLQSATRDELRELHAVIKRLTDLLKTEFFGDGSPLGLKLPKGMEGDTD